MNETVQFYIDRLRALHKEAIETRQVRYYSEGQLDFRLEVYTRRDVPPYIREFPGGVTPQQKAALRAATALFSVVQPEAVLARGDARQANMKRLIAYYRWPEGMTGDYYEEQYFRVLDTVGGTMGNLPKQLWQDVITSMIKGPHIGNYAILTTYEADPEDRVVILKTQEPEGGMESGLIPDWWTPSTQ